MNNDIFHMPGMRLVCAILLMAGMVLLFLRMPAQAAERCVKLSRVSGYETLVNTCGSCRNIRVNRDRSGVALPTARSFQMTAFKKQDLFFKGPGRTRIISDEACGLENGVNQSAKRKAEDQLKSCIVPVQTQRGIVMANGCTSCRKIIVKRQFAEGGNTLTPYTFQAKGVLALESDGAINAQIIDDKPCKL